MGIDRRLGAGRALDLWGVTGPAESLAVTRRTGKEHGRAFYQELNVSIDYHTDGRLHVKPAPNACADV